tara:strand:+ start:6282 stop:6641 length:360 start_codon:yes stop_codon:yes gene_type:complete
MANINQIIKEYLQEQPVMLPMPFDGGAASGKPPRGGGIVSFTFQLPDSDTGSGDPDDWGSGGGGDDIGSPTIKPPLPPWAVDLDDYSMGGPFQNDDGTINVGDVRFMIRGLGGYNTHTP